MTSPLKSHRQTTIAGNDISLDECRAVWLAVIERAVLDARWNPDKVDKESRSGGIPHTQMVNARGDALRWLRGNTEGFRFVCEAAGLNPAYVKRLAIEQFGEDLIWNNHFRIGRGDAPQGADT